MARISATAGPSNADLAKEIPVLVQQGKVKPGASTQLNEWSNWKVSLWASGIVRSAVLRA